MKKIPNYDIFTFDPFLECLRNQLLKWDFLVSTYSEKPGDL